MQYSAPSESGEGIDIYMQTVRPHKAAEAIMMTCKELHQDWIEDLQLLAKMDSAEERGKMFEERVEREEDLDGDLHIRVLPADNHPMLRAEAQRTTADDSRMRRLNMELLQRACTVLAMKTYQKELAQKAVSKVKCARELVWIEEFCRDWWPRLTGVVTTEVDEDGDDITTETVSDSFFRTLDHRMPTYISNTLIDPPGMSERLYEHREKAALHLLSQLNVTESRILTLQRECLERALHA